MLLGEPHAQVVEGLLLLVLLLLVAHLVKDHGLHQGGVLAQGELLHVVGVHEVGRRQVESGPKRHQIDHDLHEALLLQGV